VNSQNPPHPARASRQGVEWITNGNLLAASWRLALPMTLAAVLADTLALTDMFFVGKLGHSAMGAVATCGVLLQTVYTFQIGITVGCTALVAQAVGAGRPKDAERATAQTLLMGAALAGIVAAVGIPLAGSLLEALGAEQDIVAQGAPYLRISAAGAIALLTNFALASALRGAGDAITPLKVMLVTNALNIGLDPVLIYGWLGAPRLGVAGSALATIISAFVGCAWLAWVFFSGRHMQFHLRPSDLRPAPALMWRLIKMGTYGAGQMLIRNISALSLVSIVARFGSVYLAAYGVGIRLFFAVLTPGMGFGNAAATMVGQNLGAGKPERAARATWISTGIWTGISTLIGIVFIVFARQIVSFFNDTPEVVSVGSECIIWLAATFAFTAASVVIGRAMNGAGDMFWPMMATAVSMLGMRIPLAMWLARAMGDVRGVWIAMTVSNVAQGVFFAALFLWGRWKVIGCRLVAEHARGA
jgi:putative MATE family efflux protein